MEGVIVSVVLFICTTALVFGLRYMTNKEKMAMIERGMDPGMQKARPAAPTPFISLKFGLLLVGLGLGLIFALFTVWSLTLEKQDAVAIYFGFICVFGGLGLIISYAVEKKWLDQQKD
ncbi:DUF6249 domain-containing protein [Pedobacter frigoris]|uniref:DUF6249 domain-containing protein n=1 Tax=Pedobacter frigoris TaxID=2571272 RepID=UPI00292D6788|nr:DUF6249 domain-containing protein [Pedobacter frigoris]